MPEPIQSPPITAIPETGGAPPDAPRGGKRAQALHVEKPGAPVPDGIADSADAFLIREGLAAAGSRGWRRRGPRLVPPPLRRRFYFCC